MVGLTPNTDYLPVYEIYITQHPYCFQNIFYTDSHQNVFILVILAFICLILICSLLNYKVQHLFYNITTSNIDTK